MAEGEARADLGTVDGVRFDCVGLTGPPWEIGADTLVVSNRHAERIAALGQRYPLLWPVGRPGGGLSDVDDEQESLRKVIVVSDTGFDIPVVARELVTSGAEWIACPARSGGAAELENVVLAEIVRAFTIPAGRLKRVTLYAETREELQATLDDWAEAFEPPAVAHEPEPRLSTSSWYILRSAAGMADGRPVTPDHVVLAALRRSVGGRSLDIGGVLLERLVQRWAEPAAVVLDHLARVVGVSDFEDFPNTGSRLVAAPGVSAIVTRAAGLRPDPAVDESIHARHLLAAAAVTGLRPEAYEVLEITAPQLVSLVVASILDTLRAEPRDHWRALLVLPSGDIGMSARDQDDLRIVVARVFADGRSAENLLTQIGFPRNMWPGRVARSPDEWWTEIFVRLDTGIIPNPYGRLLEAALRVYAYNPTFRRLGLAYGLIATGEPEAPEPVAGRAEAPVVDPALSLRVELAGGMSADLVPPDRGIPLADDHLGVATYVQMLATVIARADTPLPLSVGLFGDWGTGKSYFMGLLRQQVSELTAEDAGPYLSNVVQIGFNAWSYADSNLWASLGDEIFRQLAALGADEAGDRRREMEALGRALVESRQQAAELEVARTAANRRVTALTAEVEAARRKQVVSVADVVTAAATELRPVWSRLGVDDEVERARLLADEMRRSGADVSRIRRAVTDRRAQVLVGIAAVSAVVIAVAVLAPAGVREWLRAVGATALVLTVAGWVTVVGRALSGLHLLAGFVTRLRTGADGEARERIDRAVRAVRAARAEEQVTQSQLDDVLAQAGEIGRRMIDLTPGRRLYSFLAERSASDDYRSRLGLISTIRRDLEHLARLLSGWDPQQHDGVEAPIDRIVLYIDDLDRCSPRQVVDVLEAVHLLLALDLFVVVVGVDPRWLLHSLRQEYPTVLGAGVEADPVENRMVDDGRRSTPLDYLQKIFNIPFVLPTMTAAGFGTMIRELSAEPPRETRRPRGRAAATPAAPAPPLERVPQPIPPVDAGPGPQDDLAAAGVASAAPPVQAGSEIDRTRRGAPVETRPLVERELELLSALAPLVRTPREAKRMLNLYRMLRSTQNLSEASRFLGADDEAGEYQAVGTLLGLLTAEPAFLRRLLHAPGGLHGRPTLEVTWAVVLEGLRPRPVDDGYRNDVAAGLSAAERARWLRLVELATPAAALVTLPDVTAFASWGRHVVRFSFVPASLAGTG